MQFFFEQLFEFKKRYEHLHKRETKLDDDGNEIEIPFYDEDEIEAGMEELSKTYGIMLTVHQLAKGDILKMDEVIQIDAETFYYFLSMEKDISSVQKEMDNIRKRRSEFDELNRKAQNND